MKKWIFAVVVMSMTVGFCEEEQSQTDFNFIRDFMQPLGMPTVTAYYAVRENVFLNTRSNQDNFFEAVGNAFLIPTRYLFAGKTVRMENNECKVQQNFSYRNFHWFKTPLALVSLPFSFAAGSLFKAIGYLSPKARKRHQSVDLALHAPKIKPASYGIDPLYSDEFAECQNLERPSDILKKHKKEVQALKDVVDVLNKEGIVYFVDCGTALGAYRYGGFIPWDNDIDIAILMPDHENAKRALLNFLDQEKYAIQDWSSYSHPSTFLKLYIKETKTQIDLFHYMIDQKNKTLSFYFTYLNSPFPESWKKPELPMINPVSLETVFPLKKANFDGLVVWVPNNITAFLKNQYGENLDPTMLWSETDKKYHKVLDHPYWKTLE